MKYMWIIGLSILCIGCSQQQKQEQDSSVDTPVQTENTTDVTVQEEITQPEDSVVTESVQSSDNRFVSPKEAYDEGYCNGYQEGYTDAINHLDVGYNYNDEPEYSGYLADYVEGYMDGYTDGYTEGWEWNYEND